MAYKPKFISFDCYGTLVNFEMGPAAKMIFEVRVRADRMPAFLDGRIFYRLDEVRGRWKPFIDAVENSIRRACKAQGIEYRSSDAAALHDAIPTWQHRPDAVETPEAIAPRVLPAILSNSMVDLIPRSVADLKPPFHAVYTANEARACKPRGQAFEYMFEQLGCEPDQMMHVSSSFRYDLMTVNDLGFMAKALIDRSHEPGCDCHGVNRLADIRQLPGFFRLDRPSLISETGRVA